MPVEDIGEPGRRTPHPPLPEAGRQGQRLHLVPAGPCQTLPKGPVAAAVVGFDEQDR